MSRSRRPRWLVAPTLLLVGLLLPSASTATHMVPTPLKIFWDPNQDAVPGPEPVLDPEGGYWESLRTARLDGALSEWRGETTFDPTRSSSGTIKVFVDGRLGWCMDYWETDDEMYLAVTCLDITYGYSNGFHTYWRIADMDLFFNMERPAAPDWWIGSTLTSDPGRLDFQGVMTHEVGHMILLDDVDGPNDCIRTAADQLTMCGSVRLDGRLDTWRNRSLHSHDISAANAVY